MLRNLTKISVFLGTVVWSMSVAASPITITTTHLKRNDSPVEYVFMGILQAKHLSLIQAKTAGQIESILFFPGDKIKQNDVLAKLRPTSQKIELAEAQASFDQAKLSYVIEKNNFSRAEKLHHSGAIPKSEYQLEVLRFNSAKTMLNKASLNLKAKQLNLSYVVIKSPINGSVFKKKVFGHSVVKVGQPLYVLASTNRLRIDIPVPLKFHNIFQEQDSVKVINSINHKQIVAKVASISPIANEKTNAINIYVDVDNEQLGWLPGNVVKVIFPGKVKQKFEVPSHAVVYQNDKPSIFVIKDGRAKLQQLDSIMLLQDKTRVDGKLLAGDVIAVDGADKLHDGAAVKIISREVQ